jgi:hypothetical protein
MFHAPKSQELHSRGEGRHSQAAAGGEGAGIPADIPKPPGSPRLEAFARAAGRSRSLPAGLGRESHIPMPSAGCVRRGFIFRSEPPALKPGCHALPWHLPTRQGIGCRSAQVAPSGVFAQSKTSEVYIDLVQFPPRQRPMGAIKMTARHGAGSAFWMSGRNHRPSKRLLRP